MLYMFLLYWDESRASEDGGDALRRHFEFAESARAQNAYVYSEALGGAGSATTINFKGGKATPTDGPYVETREVVGGFYVLDCEDLDEAIRYGEQMGAFAQTAVEIRPVIDVTGWDYGATADRKRHTMR